MGVGIKACLLHCSQHSSMVRCRVLLLCPRRKGRRLRRCLLRFGRALKPLHRLRQRDASSLHRKSALTPSCC